MSKAEQKSGKAEVKQIAPTGDEIKTGDNPKSKRNHKNNTASTIDPAVPDSVNTWIKDFQKHSIANPPVKGYDQHWNHFGFIHFGTANRLSTQGCGRMLAVIFDMLANRALDGDKEANAMIPCMVAFGKGRKEQVKSDRHNLAIAEAANVIKAAGGSVQLK